MIRANDPSLACVVAIPAKNEACHLAGCLAALALQRDTSGCPLPENHFSIVLLANNCTDATIAIAEGMAGRLPFRLHIRTIDFPAEQANAGWARKLAMDEAAFQLSACGSAGALLTTDADTRVDPTWVDENLGALAAGADAVAGYVVPDATDYLGLGGEFMRRGRLEDRYLRLCAELWAILDPRQHDPWPNHRMASGASLAVTLAAYGAVGGLPPIPLGEDAALAAALERDGYRIRHSLAARVTTSCRLDGRAKGGAGDTMRLRSLDCDAECDADMEPFIGVARRALWKGRVRRWYERGGEASADLWALALCVAAGPALCTAGDARTMPFATLWSEIEEASPRLRRGAPLRPGHLPGQIEIAEMILDRLRLSSLASRAGDPAGSWVREPGIPRMRSAA